MQEQSYRALPPGQCSTVNNFCPKGCQSPVQSGRFSGTPERRGNRAGRGFRLPEHEDPALAYERNLPFDRSAEHQGGILEGSPLAIVEASALEHGRAADRDERQQQLRHRRSDGEGSRGAAPEALAQVAVCRRLGARDDDGAA